MTKPTKYGEGLEIHIRDDIDQGTGAFRIDGIIREYWSRGEIRPHFLTEQHAVGFGRRTLDISIHQGIGASEELLKGVWRDEWVEAEKLAQSALTALSALLKSMIGDARPPTSTSLLPPLRHMAISSRAEREQKPQLESAMKEAQTNAETLINAAALLREMTAFSIKKGDHLAGRGNPGDPVKAAFVFAMAQGWLTLTGAIPGTNTTMIDNPFMRFAAAGWADAGGRFGKPGKGETLESINSFGQSAIASAIKKLADDPATSREDYRPSWA